MSKKSKKHSRNDDGMVYSTNPDMDLSPFASLGGSSSNEITGSGKEQNLKVMIDKKSRGGKKVTLVTGFTGMTKDIEDLGKKLKSKCGVGGAVKDREIMIQGDFKEKVYELLIKEGHGVKKVGG